MIVFWAIAMILLSVIAFGNRDKLLDQDNYIQYFAETNIQWFTNLWRESPTLFSFFARLVSDEAGWHAWVLLINWTGVTPEVGVRITVVTLNALILLALSRLRRPLWAISLWAITPVALPTIGLFQLRQGFALSIALFFALCRRKPIRGAAIASIVHTTYAFPAAFLLISRLLMGRKEAFRAATVAAVGLVLALSSSALFNAFGGRRVDEYQVGDVEFNWTFVVAIFIYLTVPILALQTRTATNEDPRDREVIDGLAIMHIGICVFLVAAFFVFPFAMTRIGYYVPALVAVLLPQIRLRTPLVLWIVAMVIATVGYDVIKHMADGTYNYFL